MKTITIDQFMGLNNKAPREHTPMGFAKILSNWDITAYNTLQSRRGYQKLYNGTAARSLWATPDSQHCFFADEDNLYYYAGVDSEPELLASGVGKGQISYTAYDGNVYINSDTTKLKAELKRGGLPKIKPWGSSAPTITQIINNTGTLKKGCYSIAATRLNSEGVESGTRQIEKVTLTSDGSGIAVNVSYPENTTAVILYSTTVDGTELMENSYKEITNTSAGVATFNITKIKHYGGKLLTWNMIPPVDSEVMATFNDRLLIANGNVLYYTDPYRPELFHSYSNFFQFNGQITNICPTESGCYVIADRMYFMKGLAPEEWDQVAICKIRGIKGSEVEVLSSELNMEGVFAGRKWFLTTNRGIFLLSEDGITFNLTENNNIIDTPVTDDTEGAALFRLKDGRLQYIVNHIKPFDKEKEVGAISDSATFVIIPGP